VKRGAPIFPEYSVGWIEEELDSFEKRPGDRFTIDESEKVALREIFSYWKGKTVYDRVIAVMPESVRSAWEARVLSFTVADAGTGHLSIDYGKAVRKGIGGLLAEVEDARTRLSRQDVSQAVFLDAVSISLKAAASFIQRFALFAEQKAELIEDVARKEELRRIARVCGWVSWNAPRDFHEAIQLFWFIHLILHIDSNGHSMSPGRFDQYIYPYYVADLQRGVPRAQLKELLECLWLKFNELVRVRSWRITKQMGGHPMFQSIVIGGQTADGRDATNELSELCLEVTAELGLPQPSLYLRYHENSPGELLMKACEVIRLGIGMPALINDEVIIPSLLSVGCTLEDARDYAVVGCLELNSPGKTNGFFGGGHLNLGKCLELALRDGYDIRTKKQLGPRTGRADGFNGFEDVWQGFSKQLEYFVELHVAGANLLDAIHAEMAPLPFASALMDDCVARATCLTQGGARYNYTTIQGVGIADVADSLAVLKKLVFEEKKISLQQLMDLLDNDFEGKEDVRQMLVNRAPKYGNGEEYVDQIAAQLVNLYCDLVSRHKNRRGGKFQPGLHPATAHIMFGGVTGALPSGRRAGQPLAEGVSPVHGRDTNGPTGVIASVARIDHLKVTNGTLLNMMFHPSALQGESALRCFLALIRTYFRLKGLHVQFNVVSREVLLDAQKNPDRYRALVVRVAGYSAFFTSLEKAVQDDIISRTPYTLCPA